MWARMAIVWHAWDERLHRPVAVRILRVEPRIGGAERQQAADRAMRAGRQAAELQHPHVVAVIDVLDHNGHPCFVTPLIESTPLALVLRERGTLPPSEAAGIGAQVASALAAAHTMSIVHGGVDPDCVALTPDGSAMVGDFGMAQALRESTGAPGSASTAPEVAKGRTPGYAADVYSLGVMLYEMVEGTTPFAQGDDAAGPRTFAGRYRRPEHAGVSGAAPAPHARRAPEAATQHGLDSGLAVRRGRRFGRRRLRASRAHHRNAADRRDRTEDRRHRARAARAEAGGACRGPLGGCRHRAARTASVHATRPFLSPERVRFGSRRRRRSPSARRPRPLRRGKAGRPRVPPGDAVAAPA